MTNRKWIVERLLSNNEQLFYYPEKDIFSSKEPEGNYINFSDMVGLYKLGFSKKELAEDLLKEVT